MVSAFIPKDTPPAHWPSICKKSSFQTQLPEDFDLGGSLKDQEEYFGHFHKEFVQSFVTCLCLKIPKVHRGKASYPWGIAWGSKQTTEGFGHGFISTLPNGWMPNNPFEFFQQFVDRLRRKWNKSCSKLAGRVEKLVGYENIVTLFKLDFGTDLLAHFQRSDQVNSRGGNSDLIDHLAQASKSRAQLSKCLQLHIDGINDVITNSTSFDLEQKAQLAADMETFEKRLTSNLSHSEQSIRELLQIVRTLNTPNARY